MAEIIDRMRKGDVFLCSLPINGSSFLLQGEHFVVIWSNYKFCDFSSSIQIIPITSKEKRPLDTHVKISKGMANLDLDSTVLAEQITTLDKGLLKYKLGQLSTEKITEIDRAMSIQLNSNRVFNISFAQKIVDNIVKLDNMTKKFAIYDIEIDQDDKELRKTLLNDLREYCYQWNIDFRRLLIERGVNND